MGYHFPEVETLRHSLSGLSEYKSLPENYVGVAIYCEWEMDLQARSYFNNMNEFTKAPEGLIKP